MMMTMMRDVIMTMMVIRKTMIVMMREMMMRTTIMITMIMIMKKGCIQLDFCPSKDTYADEKYICSIIEKLGQFVQR